MDIFEFYKTHGVMTEPGRMKSMVKDIPKDIKTIGAYVQNIFLHQHWAGAYGLQLTEERKQEPWIRSFEEKLSFLQNQDYRHVSEVHPLEKKMIGICRDFSVAAAALCIEAGIPARARCGFATYFEEGKYIDHWVLEYYHEEQQRWILVDTQLDALQRMALNIPFDTLDVSKEYFLTAPAAWKLCREGKENPEKFGIFQWWGYDYLRCNLLLDVNSLIKLPMQPWDGWEGYKVKPLEAWTSVDYETIDELTALALNVNEDLEALYRFIEKDDKIKVPKDLSKVMNSLS